MIEQTEFDQIFPVLGQVSTVEPRQRIVVAVLGLDDEQHILPVVLIQSNRVDIYETTGLQSEDDFKPPESSSVADLIMSGFRLTQSKIDHDFIVVAPNEYDPISINSFLVSINAKVRADREEDEEDEETSSVAQAVVCHWPAEEDQTRLASVFDRLREIREQD